MLYISTSCNYNADAHMRDWLLQIKDCGFDGFELDYKLSREQIEQVFENYQELGLKCSSIHNYCPCPDDGPWGKPPTDRHLTNYYRLSATDEKERKKAVKWTKSSVDTAIRFGAKAVVIHAGTVNTEDEYCRPVFDLYKEDKRFTTEFEVEREKLLYYRRENVKPHIEALEKSFQELVEYSFPKGITIGLETRYYPIEIPNYDEINYFLEMFPQGIKYWHDIGHAEMNSRLGIRNHLDFLRTNKGRIVGIHVHGMLGHRDHQPPFEGDLDIDPILEFARGDVLKVVESRKATPEEMKRAVEGMRKYE